MYLGRSRRHMLDTRQLPQPALVKSKPFGSRNWPSTNRFTRHWS